MNLNFKFSALTNLHSQSLSSPRRHSTEGTTISGLTSPGDKYTQLIHNSPLR